MKSSKLLHSKPSSVTLLDLWKEFLPLSLSDVTMALGDPLQTTTLAHLPDARSQSQLNSRPQTMLLLNPDRGDRYMETVYDPQWLAEQEVSILKGTDLMQSIDTLQPVPLTTIHAHFTPTSAPNHSA